MLAGTPRFCFPPHTPGLRRISITLQQCEPPLPQHQLVGSLLAALTLVVTQFPRVRGDLRTTLNFPNLILCPCRLTWFHNPIDALKF